MMVFAIMLMLAGLFLAAFPRAAYETLQSWKHGGGTEPSGLYLIITRVQGVLLVIVGIILMVR